MALGMLCACIFVGVGWLLSARFTNTEHPIVCKDCNIILISIDPLREDAVPLYKNDRLVTPWIGSLTESGFVFGQAYAVAPWTLPSAMSLMTGVYPSMHGIINKEHVSSDRNSPITPSRLSDSAPHLRTLAEDLKENGYVTGGFAGGAALSSTYGFDKGFDEYTSGDAFDGLPTSAPMAVDFIRKHRNEKMFVFIHGFDVHGQYIPTGGYERMFVRNYSGTLNGSTEEQKQFREEGVKNGRIFLTPDDAKFLRGLYDEKVVRLDEMIGVLIREIRAQKIADKTIIIFTSDHGDEFYEHGRIDHGMTLFDEVLHVPLYIVVPGYSGRKIMSQVRNIDIAPTVLSLIGKEAHSDSSPKIAGVSLTPLMRGKVIPLDVFAETSYRYATFQKAVRTPDSWKLIIDEETQNKELFNIEKDPGELDDLTRREDEMESALLRKFIEFKNTYHTID